MRIAILLDDAYGGRGGIAQFNRDFIEACCTDPARHEVVLFQRIGTQESPAPLPAGARYAVHPPKTFRYGRNVSIRYVLLSVFSVLREGRFDLIVCGHLYLLPLAAPLAAATGAKLATVMHGVEAWGPSRHRLADMIARRVRNIISVSGHTYARFLGWSGNRNSRPFFIPNTVDVDRFRAPLDTAALRSRLGLEGRRIILTLGRLSSQERYKGYDEILEVLPRVRQAHPSVVYVLGGDGDDRPRLEAKAAQLGVSDLVLFPGYLPEADKPLYYQMADLFLLAGRGEGFGIVLLEALASGCPVIASNLDASAEAVLHGELGTVVDPGNPQELAQAIVNALKDGRRSVPEGLDYYRRERFAERVQHMLRCLALPQNPTSSPPLAAGHGISTEVDR
jgi:phosphatidylinositol alpha-1,6-mannosyltransferase